MTKAACAAALVPAVAPPTAIAQVHDQSGAFDSERSQSQTSQWLSFLGAHSLQTKLTIGAVNDPLEREADAAANRVMRIADPAISPGSATPRLSRKCETCEDEEQSVHRKEVGADTAVDTAPPVVEDVLRGSGQPLDQATHEFMSGRFGNDFSDVRIHTGEQAAQSAAAVGARAYTVGSDVVFGAGQYDPVGIAGRHLLAHELAHVVQQGEGRSHIQRLTITQHALTKGTCGGRNVQWIFSLDKPAPEDGYIVQQIDRNEFVANCPDLAMGPPAPLPTFWEAWFVKKGDKLDWLAATMPFTDGNTRPARPRTNGRDGALGKVKFFTKATTGDLGRDNVAPTDPKSNWGPGKVPNSGALPSTASEPSWWSGTPAEGPAVRNVVASWDCCDADAKKHSFDLTTTP